MKNRHQTTENFRQWLETLGYSETTVYNLPNHINELLDYAKDNEIDEIKDINNKLANSYINDLQQRKNKRKNGLLSQNYINKHIQAIKLFARYLQETKKINLQLDINSLEATKPEITILTKAEIKSLFAATEETKLEARDRAMLAIYYGCGLRRNEGINLTAKDVMWRKGLLYVRKGKNNKERYVPMNKEIIKELKSYINARKQLPTGKETRLFVSKSGKPINGQSLQNRLQKLIKTAGITKQCTLHTLRHSIATHLLQSGMKLENISQFLGHSSLESTQIYTHLVSEQ